MKKRLLSAILILSMVVSLCAGLAISANAAEIACYTLTPAAGSNNSYAGNCDIAIDGITWNLTGNSTIQPWRIGGKSLDAVDREVYSKTAMSDTITKVELEVGTASGITVNSLTLTVASDADFTNVISTVSAPFIAESTITFLHPSADAAWTNAYYKFTFNVTVSVTSNKYVQFVGASFYHGSFDPGCAHANAAEVAAVAATCTTAGNIAYYYCADCGTYFTDSTLETTTTLEAVTIAAGHHYVDGVCSVCGAQAYLSADSVFVGDRIILVAAYNDRYYAMANDDSVTNALVAAEVTVSGDEVIPGDADVVWEVVAGNAAGSFLLKSCDDTYIYWTSGTTVKLGSVGTDFTISCGDGTSAVLLTDTVGTEEVRGLIFRDNSGAYQFRAYNTDNASQSGYSGALTIYAIPHEHVPVAAAAVSATCSTAGHTAGNVCSVCGKPLDCEEIPALGHDWVAGTPVAVTCTTDGYTPYSCSRCNETKEDDIVAALGHTYVDGVCSVCGATITAGWYLVDDYSNLTNGVYALLTPTYYAFNGSIVSGHGQVTSEALTFDANGYAATAPTDTCKLTFTNTANGFTLYNDTYGYLYASAASSGKLAFHETETSGWSFSADGGIYAANNAHLRTYNNTFRTYSGITNQTVLLARFIHAHAAESVATIPATCTAAGTTAGTVCSICGEILSGCEEIPALGHDWSAGTPVAATCTEDGYTPYSCSRCNETKEENIVPALGHDWIAGTPVVADGVTDGYTPYTCSRCDATKQDDIVHNYVCGVCTVCGAPVETFAVANSVSVGDRIVLVAAYNSKYYAMANDNATDSSSLAATEVTVSGSEVTFGDLDVVWEVVAGTEEGTYQLKNKDGSFISYNSGTMIRLTDTGTDFTITCGEGISSAIVTSTLSETYIRGLMLYDNGVRLQFRAYRTQNATLSGYSDGLTIYTIPADAHTVEAVPAVPATCTTSGTTAGTVCSVCGKLLSGCEEIAPLGHTLGAATDNNDGTHTQTCSVCNTAVTSDCTFEVTEAGGNEFECTVCGYTKTLPQFTKTTDLANGSRIVIYHPNRATVLSAAVSGTKLSAVAVPSDYYSGTKLCLPEGAAIMTVVDYNSATGEFHLTIDDNGVTKYLTSAATGSGLSFAAAPASGETDYGLWTIDTTTGLILTNVNAAYNGRTQSIECYNNLFTTYSTNTGSAYQIELFTGNAACAHEHTTLTGAAAATCTADGYTGDEVCDDCGATVSYGTVLPATGHTYVDGVCVVCGAEEPAGLTGNYYIAAKRATGNYFWMTNDVGTASTKRYQAEDSGLTVLPAAIASDVDTAKLWRLELQQDGTYLLSSNGQYSAYSGSSNTAFFGETGIAITVTESGSAVNMMITDVNEVTRYLALNNVSGNNWFAYYKAGQALDLYLVPVTACLSHLPTIIDNGDGTHSEVCSICGAALSEDEAHTFDEGVCTVCGAVDTQTVGLKIETASLTLYQDIAVNFAAAVPTGMTDPYMVIEINGQSYTVTPSREDAQGRLVFEFMNLTPDMMGDNIKSTLYATTAGGQLVHYCKPTYSVKQYCTNVMAAYPEDAKLQTLLADMLVYGAATQTFTGHNADSLVTAGLDLTAASTFTNPPDSIQSTTESTDADIRWTGAGLECGSRMSMYFTLLTSASDATSVTVTINGRTTEYEYADIVTDDPGVCRVVFRGISASEYDDVVTAVVKNNGTPVQTLTYSVNSYISNKYDDPNVENLAQLVQAIYNYGVSAKSYLNQ